MFASLSKKRPRGTSPSPPRSRIDNVSDAAASELQRLREENEYLKKLLREKNKEILESIRFILIFFYYCVFKRFLDSICRH